MSMDYDKLARETVEWRSPKCERCIETHKKIAQALERAELEGRRDAIVWTRRHTPSDGDRELTALRKRLEELNARSPNR